MRHSVYLMMFIFLSTASFAQENIEIFSRLLPNESKGKISLRGCSGNTLFYYIDGERVDMVKTYIRSDNIKDITILQQKETKLLFGHSLDGCSVIISLTNKIKLLSLTQFFKTNNIKYTEAEKTRIEINGVVISDTTILIDSRAKVKTHKRTLAGNDDASSQVKNILLISIVTNFTKRYGS